MAAQYVLVGSGIAALAAAEALRAREPRANIVLVSEETHDFYSRPGLAYLLRGDFPEKQLFIRSSGRRAPPSCLPNGWRAASNRSHATGMRRS